MSPGAPISAAALGAVDQSCELTGKALKARGLFSFCERAVLRDHGTIGPHKVLYDQALRHAVPLQGIHSRVEPARVCHCIAVRKQPLNLL